MLENIIRLFGGFSACRNFSGRLLKSFIFVLGLLVCFSASAQEKLQFQTTLRFKWDDATLFKDYRGNAEAFARLDSLMNTLNPELIDSVSVVSQSSPEGTYKHNFELSRQRAYSTRWYITKYYPYLQGKVQIHPDGEAWGMLREYVLQDKVLTRESINRIVNIIDSNVRLTLKKQRLEALPEYKYLLKTYYPLIRHSVVLVIYYNGAAGSKNSLIELDNLGQLLEVELEDPNFEFDSDQAVLDLPALPDPSQIGVGQNQAVHLLSLKTNLLYDAVTAINAEVEIPLGSHGSLLLEDVSPWWETGNKYCFEMWEMGAEFRYYAKAFERPAKMRGAFAGLYAMSAKFDFQYDTQLNYQGEYWSAGLTLGYVLPLGAKEKFSLEFSVSAGMLSSSYRHYQPSSDYDMLIRDPYNIGRISYFGPTKAKISLVYPIVYNPNRKK